MSKRLIASIKSSIVRLDKKIITGTEEISGLKLQREKFLEMLELVEPKQEEANAPENPIPAIPLTTGTIQTSDGKPVAFMESAKKKLAEKGEAA